MLCKQKRVWLFFIIRESKFCWWFISNKEQRNFHFSGEGGEHSEEINFSAEKSLFLAFVVHNFPVHLCFLPLVVRKEKFGSDVGYCARGFFQPWYRQSGGLVCFINSTERFQKSSQTGFCLKTLFWHRGH